MTDDSVRSWAGFSRGEWIAAFARVYGEARAIDEADRVLAVALAEHGEMSGFALSPSTWALLALVDDSCAERVRALTAHYPAAMREQIAARIADYG